MKYIGDKDWGCLKEEIHEGPLSVRTHVVYLNIEIDMDTIMDNIVDPVAGNPNRNKVVNGNVCIHVDDLIFTGTKNFLDSFAQSLRKPLLTPKVLKSRVWYPFFCFVLVLCFLLFQRSAIKSLPTCFPCVASVLTFVVVQMVLLFCFHSLTLDDAEEADEDKHSQHKMIFRLLQKPLCGRRELH